MHERPSVIGWLKRSHQQARGEPGLPWMLTTHSNWQRMAKSMLQTCFPRLQHSPVNVRGDGDPVVMTAHQVNVAYAATPNSRTPPFAHVNAARFRVRSWL